MATVLYCDPDVLGRVPKVWCDAELGEESPLEFDDGHALVDDDDAADRLVVRRGPIEYAGADGNDGNPAYFEDDAASETCQTVKGDGEVCVRELPCPYHSED